METLNLFLKSNIFCHFFATFKSIWTEYKDFDRKQYLTKSYLILFSKQMFEYLFVISYNGVPLLKHFIWSLEKSF